MCFRISFFKSVIRDCQDFSEHEVGEIKEGPPPSALRAFEISYSGVRIVICVLAFVVDRGVQTVPSPTP